MTNKTALILALVVGGALLLYSRRPQSTPVTPAPGPVAAGKLVVVTMPSCSWCDRLKRDWPQGYPVPHEYVDASSGRYKVRAAPTLILLDGDREVKRHEGYLDPGKLRAWLGSK
jgi:hypothetical protein